MGAMDITLIRTFLEVAASGSFISASDRLFVTQSAVSLRIARLESTLGRPLFVRSKAGAELTTAGLAFLPYAQNLTRVWSQARQHVAVPEGYSDSLSIGAELSLWPRMGFRWLDELRAISPDIDLRAEQGSPEQLMRAMSEGLMQVALTYAPNLRQGLRAEEILQDELVLVSGRPGGLAEAQKNYVLIDWGPEFVDAHGIHLPIRANRGLTLAVGGMAADYIATRGFSAFLPTRQIRRFTDAGTLHIVPDVPSFPHAVWAVWRDDLDEKLADVACKALESAMLHTDEEQGAIREKLNKFRVLP